PGDWQFLGQLIPAVAHEPCFSLATTEPGTGICIEPSEYSLGRLQVWVHLGPLGSRRRFDLTRCNSALCRLKEPGRNSGPFAGINTRQTRGIPNASIRSPASLGGHCGGPTI